MIDSIKDLMVSENIKEIYLDEEGRIESIKYFKTKPALEEAPRVDNAFDEPEEVLDDIRDDKDLWPDGERPVFTLLRGVK